MADKLLDIDNEITGISKLMKKDLCNYEGHKCENCDGVDSKGDDCPYFRKKTETA